MLRSHQCPWKMEVPYCGHKYKWCFSVVLDFTVRLTTCGSFSPHSNFPPFWFGPQYLIWVELKCQPFTTQTCWRSLYSAMNPLIHLKTTPAKWMFLLVSESGLAIAGMGEKTQKRSHGIMLWSWDKHWLPRFWLVLDECEGMEVQKYRSIELRLNCNELGKVF